MLKEPNGDKPTLILLLYRYKNDRLKYSIGETIHPGEWDADSQQARTNQKNRREQEPFHTINAQLARYRTALKRILAQLALAEVTPDVVEVRSQLDKVFKKEELSKKRSQPRFRFLNMPTNFLMTVKRENS